MKKQLLKFRALFLVLFMTLFTANAWGDDDANLLPGTFSVSATKQVKFTKGNLQATYDANTSSYTWGIAAHQYDYIGNAAGNTTIGDSQTNGAVVDLFGWSTDATGNNQGINKSSSSDYYSGNFVDWGNKFVKPYSTLSKDEWNYLFFTRTGNNYARAKYKNTQGVLIFPDGYSSTSIPSDAGIGTINNSECPLIEKSMSDDNWNKLEADGVVFLPLSGKRDTYSVDKVGTYGYYWTSTPYNNYAYYLDLEYYASFRTYNYTSRYMGYSVRLVKTTPKVTLTSSLTSANKGDQITLTPTLIDFHGNPTKTYSYTKDGGSAQSLSEPEFTFTELGTYVFTVVVENAAAEESATASVTVKVKEPLLTGKFSVSPDQQIVFTRGNLLASCTAVADETNPATYQWGLSAEQYDGVGGGTSTQTTGNNRTYTQLVGDVVDLFYWSTPNNYYGFRKTSSTYPTFTGDFVDWAENFPGKGYHTPSIREFIYIINERPDANRFARAHLKDKNGLLLFPDGYADVPTDDGIAEINSMTADYPTTSITDDHWTTMESAGVVFLSAEGNRGDYYCGGTNNIYYWSSTPSGANQAIYMELTEAQNRPPVSYRNSGYSVRLVKNLPSLTLVSSSSSANVGESVTFSAKTQYFQDTPEITYVVKKDGVEISPTSGNTYKLENAGTYVCTVTATLGSETLTKTITVTAKTPLLTGKFSVSDVKKVQFTRGNLQATYNTSSSSYKWGLAANQYDVVGGVSKYLYNEAFWGSLTGNNTIDSPNEGDVVDLFGWSTTITNYGIKTSTQHSDYSTGDFVDWGKNFTADDGYFTLSEKEWQYLLNVDGYESSGLAAYRQEANRFARANVNGVNGLLIFPDGYNGGVKIEDNSITGVAKVNDKSSSASYPTDPIPSETWSTMENDGVVFLPKAICRDGSYLSSYQFASYWSSTPNPSISSAASGVYFDNPDVDQDHATTRYYGNLVRLARAFPSVTLTALTNANVGDEITLTPALSDFHGTDTPICTYSVSKDGGEATDLGTTNTYTLPSAGTYVFTVTVKNALSETETGTVTVTAREALLKGKFSVSATKQVRFTRGNLQATCTDATNKTYSWGFAGNQYDYIGNAKGNTTISSQTQGAVVDLFCWSSDATNNNYGIHTSTYASYYSANFVDWGNNFPGKGYYTLSCDELQYLMNPSGDANNYRQDKNRFAKANVKGKMGILLFPDGYNNDVAISGITGVAAVNNSNVSYPSTAISDDTWTQMQNDGVVFLPGVGMRYQSGYQGCYTYVDYVGHSFYWTATSATEDASKAWILDNGNIKYNSGYVGSKNNGISVRLVKEVPVVTVTAVESPTATGSTITVNAAASGFTGTPTYTYSYKKDDGEAVAMSSNTLDVTEAGTFVFTATATYTPTVGEAESATNSATVTIKGICQIGDTKYISLPQAIANVSAGGEIDITDDVDLPATITVASTTPAFTLDLNGHILNASGIATPTHSYEVANVIQNYGTLTIIDSNPDATHTGDFASIKGGILTGGRGGYNRAASETDTNYSPGGGAIYNGNGSLTISGGTIYKNSASRGGAILVNLGSLTMNGGTITGNESSGSGAGIFVNYQSTLTLSGGAKITNNTSQQYGGAISTGNAATVNLYDCTITGNKAKYCGGVEVWQNASLPITYNIGDKVVIKDNYLLDGTTKSDLGVYDGGTLTISSTTPLADGSEIGIFTFSGENVAQAAKFTSNGTATDLQYFFADNDATYGTQYNADASATTPAPYLSLEVWKLGDTDVDGDVTVNDYNMVKNYIEDNNAPSITTTAEYKRADANKDKATIDVADLTAMVNLIYTDATPASSAAKGLASASVASSVDGFNYYVSGNKLIISADNASEFLAAQMDITLPEGISVAKAESTGHAVSYTAHEDGTVRLLIAGLDNNCFSSTTVATVTLTGNANSVDVANVIFANTAFQSVKATAGSATGITSFENDNENVNRDGKFIENGKVVILKAGKKYNANGQQMK